MPRRAKKRAVGKKAPAKKKGITQKQVKAFIQALTREEE